MDDETTVLYAILIVSVVSLVMIIVDLKIIERQEKRKQERARQRQVGPFDEEYEQLYQDLLEYAELEA